MGEANAYNIWIEETQTHMKQFEMNTIFVGSKHFTLEEKHSVLRYILHVTLTHQKLSCGVTIRRSLLTLVRPRQCSTFQQSPHLPITIIYIDYSHTAQSKRDTPSGLVKCIKKLSNRSNVGCCE